MTPIYVVTCIMTEIWGADSVEIKFVSTDIEQVKEYYNQCVRTRNVRYEVNAWYGDEYTHVSCDWT